MRLPSGVRFPSAFLLMLAIAGIGGCARPASEAPPPSSSAAESVPTSEAAKTRELEEKAQGFKDRFDEIQSSDMSADEKARAASELVDEQQRTIQEAESGGAPEGNGEGGN